MNYMLKRAGTLIEINVCTHVCIHMYVTVCIYVRTYVYYVCMHACVYPACCVSHRHGVTNGTTRIFLLGDWNGDLKAHKQPDCCYLSLQTNVRK